MGRRGPKPLKADAIAHSALSLFVEKGVKGATTREIAKRARTTEGSLYRYYAGKDDLARRVLTRSLVDFAETIARALEGVSGPRLRLRAFVRSYVEYSREHPLEHAFVCQSNFHKLVGVPEEILRPRRILADILADGMASGEFLATDPRLLAPFISGGLSRTCPMSGESDRPAHTDRSIDTLCNIVERMVCTGAGAESMGELGSPA
jgi:AcrR family transcriptional regulator